MPRTSADLDGLRSALLVACGLSVPACTSVPATLPLPEQQPERPPSERDDEVEAPDPAPEPIPVATACVNATPVVIGRQDSGFVRCEDGALNRASAQSCASPINAQACKGVESHRSCETHADCTDAPHGFCSGGSGQMGTYCGCLYPCLDDSECGADEACVCPGVDGSGPEAARCVPAGCRTDADCPSGECGATYFFNGCGYELSLHCRAPTDSCRSDDECDGGNCMATASADGGVWAFGCVHMRCAIGRPLTVGEGVRVARVTGRAWGTTRIESLASSRARAEHWLEVAQMEHASVASFARSCQELARFGAPPRLLRDALAAAADEVRHAEQTFAIASAYAGAPLGPGPLRVDDLAASRDLDSFVTRLISEACVGETLGVAEVLALLEGELDPALRPRLEQIATDETRHAALAWRTLRWVAGRVDPARIDAAFAQAIAQITAVADEPVDLAHGRLGAAAKRRVRAQAIAEVIGPCRRALPGRRCPANSSSNSPSDVASTNWS